MFYQSQPRTSGANGVSHAHSNLDENQVDPVTTSDFAGIVAGLHNLCLTPESLRERAEYRLLPVAWQAIAEARSEDAESTLDELVRVEAIDRDQAAAMLAEFRQADFDRPRLLRVGDSAGEWESIDDLGDLPDVEPFPLDVFPQEAQDFARAAAWSIGCAVDFAAVGILAAASALIGRSAVVRIKDGYFQAPALYLAVVGTPSSGKSPALKMAMRPVHMVAERLHDEWKAAKKAKNKDDDPPPELERVVTTNATIEALGPILARNPRGIVVACDELTGFFMSMNQYKGGKGSDRQFWLSTWNGETIFIDRAKQMEEPIAVGHPFVSVVGGITPGMLSAMAEDQGRDDGLIDRFLFVYPDRKRRDYHEEGVPDDVSRIWNALATNLFKRPMMPNPDGKPKPRIVTFDPAAQAKWVDWCRSHYAEVDAEDFPDALDGPWGKLEAYTARLALILHLLRLKADPFKPLDEVPSISVEVVEDAARLTSYFKSHARRVHAALRGGAANSGAFALARRIRRWLREGRRSAFTARDLKRCIDAAKSDPDQLSKALDCLETSNIIRREQPAANSKGGRPTEKYQVNPAAFNP